MNSLVSQPRTDSLLTKRKELFSDIWRIKTISRQYVCDRFPTEKEFIEGCIDQTRDICLILAAPRSGSSVIKSVIADNDQLLSLPGEHRYYFTLLGKNFPDIQQFKECDNTAIDSDNTKSKLLETIFYETACSPATRLDDNVLLKFAFDWVSRLMVQWPDLALSPDKIISCIYNACQKFNSSQVIDFEYLNVVLLKEFTRMNTEINPYYYDVDTSLLDQYFERKNFRSCVPGQTIVEISPFVMLRPQKIRSGNDIRTKLVIKASSDPYRMNTLCDLFQSFRLNIIHLTRNPLASINGLIDGWKHHCFTQHRLDHFSWAEGATYNQHDFKKLWKFDLYEDYCHHPVSDLPELCKRQWLDSNLKILQFIQCRERYQEYARISFEAFQDPTRKAEFFSMLGTFLDIDYSSSINEAKQVNITVRPRTFRWKDRKEILLPLLNDDEVIHVSNSLGYDISTIDTWS